MDKNLPVELSRKLNTNLSFAGCGFLGIYHVGVGVCFKKFASHLLLQKIAGASAGAIVACSLLLDLQLDEVASQFFQIVEDARSYSLGPFSPSFNIQKILLDNLEKQLPADAHLRVSGRLHISLTRICDGKNIVVSRFNSREDLVDALACSFFIPGFSGLIPPKFHNVRYIDGAFSDNLVALDDNTVTVSPFSGETDISPRDHDQSDSSYHIILSNTSMELSATNARRLIRSLIPPSQRELSELCRRGFNDALDFLYRNNLISCDECSAIQMNFISSNHSPDEFDPECDKCTESRENSMNETMPEYLLRALANHAEGPNGMLTKLFKTATLPIVIPCSIATHFLKKIPSTTRAINDIRRCMSENVHQIIISAVNSLMNTGQTAEEDLIEKNNTKFNYSNENAKIRRSGNWK